MDNKSNEILHDILLKMKYDSKKTYSENVNFISEQYSSEPSGNEPTSVGVGSTNNSEYYNQKINNPTNCASKNLEYNSYYKKCILPKKTQDSQFSNYGISTGQGINYFPVDNMNDWLAVAAVYIANEVEQNKFLSWATRPHGRCTCKNCLGRQKIGGVLVPPLIETLGDENPFVCYNEQISYSKPFWDIDFNNVTSTEGRLNPSSFKKYRGYIPSWGEISYNYGTNNLKKLISKLNEDFAGGKGYTFWQNNFNGEMVINSKDLTSSSIGIHDFLGLLALGTAFIPMVGPFLSAGLGMADAALYYKEGDYEMAALAGALTLAFDVASIGTVLGKILGSTSKQMSKKTINNIVKGFKRGDLAKLTKKEYEVVKAFEANKSVWSKEVDKMIKGKSKEILENGKISSKLKPNEVKTLQNIVGVETASKVAGGTAASVWGGKMLNKSFNESFDENLKMMIEKEGFNYSGVLDAFGFGCYEGMDELLCKQNLGKLKKLWLSGWRPLNKKTLEVSQVPSDFQTDKYKNEILPSQLSKNYDFMEKLIMSSIESSSSSNPEAKKAIESNKSYKSTNTESQKVSQEEIDSIDWD
jgi:hypothetical protein